MNNWNAYRNYLRDWADDHKNYNGEAPLSYEEWMSADVDRDDTEWFASVRWCEDDIISALEDNNIKPTPENIGIVRDEMEQHCFTDSVIEAGWSNVQSIIDGNFEIEHEDEEE